MAPALAPAVPRASGDRDFPGSIATYAERSAVAGRV